MLSVPVSTVESERNEREKQRASGRAGTAGGREERLGGREERLGAPTTSFSCASGALSACSNCARFARDLVLLCERASARTNFLSCARARVQQPPSLVRAERAEVAGERPNKLLLLRSRSRPTASFSCPSGAPSTRFARARARTNFFSCPRARVQQPPSLARAGRQERALLAVALLATSFSCASGALTASSYCSRFARDLRLFFCARFARSPSPSPT